MRFTFKPRKILIQQRDRTRIHPVPAAILSVSFSYLHFPPIISCSSPQWQVFSLFLFTISTIIGLMIVNITIFIFINRSNNRYYFRQWGDVLVEASCYEFSLPFWNRLFFYICCTRTHARAYIYAYSEAARGVIPPHEKENRRIGGTNVCLPIGTMVVAGSKVENFFHVHMKGVSISSESKFLEILTRACWRWAAFQTVLLPC